MSMSSSAQAFSDWLETTPLSLTIQEIDWIIPTVQTIHILAISAVMASIVLLDLRLLGIAMRSQSAAEVARRCLPWGWYALLVLLISGALLLIGEPGRSLQNPAFILKMMLLAVVVIVTVLMQRSLRSPMPFLERARGAAATIALVSLMLWIGIIFAGRWIAYTGV